MNYELCIVVCQLLSYCPYFSDTHPSKKRHDRCFFTKFASQSEKKGYWELAFATLFLSIIVEERQEAPRYGANLSQEFIYDKKRY